MILDLVSTKLLLIYINFKLFKQVSSAPASIPASSRNAL